MSTKLTNKFIDALPADSGVLHDAHQPGLRYVPTGAGAGKWVYRYPSPTTHTRRDAGLGLYPAVPPARARQLAMDMAALVRKGIDPIDARRAERDAAREKKRAEREPVDVLTFEKAARTVHVELSPEWRNVKHRAQWINTLETYVFPFIGAKRIEVVTPAECADVLRPIGLEKPETASRVRQRMHAVFQWACEREYRASNPVAVLRRNPPREKEHQPAMAWRSVPAFVREHLSGSEHDDMGRAALLFTILTAARSGEVRGAMWNEIDFVAAVWTVPASRMKAKKAHRVPLSAPVLAMLHALQARALHTTLVFPSPRGKVLCDMTLTALLRRVRAASDTEDRVATAHGFRSSFRDWASESEYARDLAERALAHTIQNKTEASYHRTDLLDQRRPMMDAWTAHVLGDVHASDPK